MPLDGVHEAHGFSERLGEQNVGRRLPEVGDPLEDLLRRLGAEARQPGEASIARRLLQLLERLDAESVVDLADLGGAEPRHAHHLDEPFGGGLLQLLEIGGLAELAQVAHDGERGRPEPAHLGELAGAVHLADVVGVEIENGPRRALVCPALEPILAMQLEELGDLVQRVRHGPGVHIQSKMQANAE